ELTSQGNGIGQIEDDRFEGGIALAGGTGQVPRGPTQIDEAAEATEVKGGDDPRGAQQPEAMHAEQEFALRLFGTKEALKNRALPAKRLLPTVSAFPDGVFEVRPQAPEKRIGVLDVAGQAPRT